MLFCEAVFEESTLLEYIRVAVRYIGLTVCMEQIKWRLLYRPSLQCYRVFISRSTQRIDYL